MTLQEAEIKLSELNEEINRLLAEREDVLKEWNDAFGKENPQNIICIDENVGDSHNLYLVNGGRKSAYFVIGVLWVVWMISTRFLIIQWGC